MYKRRVPMQPTSGPLSKATHVQSHQIIFPEVAKKFQKMPKSEFWLSNIPYFSNLAKKWPKICSIYGEKIATSGHSAGHDIEILGTP